MRQSERVLLRIPIEVEGGGPEGKPFSEKTYTLVINRHGAQIGLKTPLSPDQGIIIINRQNKMACPFRVVRKVGKPLAEDPEWGVECLAPETDFWGVSFPEKTEATPKQELIDALLECLTCHGRELAQLTTEDYRALTAQSPLGRKCPKCGATTHWRFGFLEASPNDLFAGSTPKQRRAKRFTVKMPVRVRLHDGREEFTETENLSRCGACFLSSLLMEETKPILVSLGHGLGETRIEMEARIVWGRKIEGVSGAIYGLEFNPSIADEKASADSQMLAQGIVWGRA